MKMSQTLWKRLAFGKMTSIIKFFLEKHTKEA